MLSITKLFSALGTLAESVLALSATVNQANTALRQRLALDHAEELPALDGPAENGSGRRGKRQTT